MACTSEKSTSSSQGLPYPPGESKLELTPIELLAMIFGQLSPKRLLSFLDSRNQTLLEAHRTAHRNMISLCLTSKRVDRVARPLLFQNITITSPANMLILYESLQESAQLGCHVKQLSFDILLGNARLCDFFPLPSSRCANLLTGWDEDKSPKGALSIFSRRNSESYSTYCCDQILSSCYFEILRRTPHIHRLVLRTEARNLLDNKQRNFLSYPENICGPFFKRVASETNQSITVDGPKFLAELKTLQILGDQENMSNKHHIGTFEPLLRLPNLQSIACSEVLAFPRDLICKDPENSRPVPIFENIKTAEFQDFVHLKGGFCEWSKLFPDLESLKIPVRIHNIGYVRGWYGRDLFGELQEAVAPMKNLHTLVLEFRYEGDWDRHIVRVPLTALPKPPRGNLAPASLPKLATITIPLELLVEEHIASTLTMDDYLASILPQSLRRLILTVQVCCHGHWTGYKDRSAAGAPSITIIAFLEALSRLGHGAFPDLEEVVCCYSMKGYKSWPGFETVEIVSTNLEEMDLFELDTDSSERLEQLRASIQLQKIRFSVAFESLDCLHDYDTDYYIE